MLFMALIPTTILVVVGYFVLANSATAEGTVRTFGKYLAIWVFILAALIFVGAATAPMFGGQPFGMRGHMMGGMHMRGMMGRSDSRGMNMDMNRSEPQAREDKSQEAEPTPPK